MVLVTADAFWRLAENELLATLTDRSFRAHFGASPALVAELWDRIQPPPDGSAPVHLLWTMAFLKMYETEETRASRFGTSAKTWR